MRLRLLALLVLTCGVAFVGASTGKTAKAPVVSAGAYAVQVNIPGQPGVSAAGTTAPGEVTNAAADTFAYPADASAVKTGGLSASAFADGTTAQGVGDVLGISLFNGEITADSVAARAKASETAADAVGSAVTNLVILGQGVTPVPNQRVPLADWGYAITLELAAEAPVADDTRNARATVTALRVVLLADHGGLPAGTDILIGHAEASSSTPVAAATKPPAPRPAQPVKPGRPAGVPPRKSKPSPKSEPRVVPGLGGPLFTTPPQNISAPLSPNGYVFPVYGDASFGDTWGAPRATTGRHQGTDIFAPLGAPVLAVADGTLFSVGWNRIGGWRLWLRDRQGNQFYYAHLAAFSVTARNGAEVRAGQVVGFNGNSGDAQGTPFHVHFEIHPVGLLPLGYEGGAVNPVDYLSAWRRVEDVSFAVGRGWAPPVPTNATAPRPGALLLSSTDISSASGLEPGSLERALVAPVSAEGDGALRSD